MSTPWGGLEGRWTGDPAPLAAQGVQVDFHFLPTAEHADSREEASGRHDSILLPYDLAVPGEEDLGVGMGRAVRERAWLLPWGDSGMKPNTHNFQHGL